MKTEGLLASRHPRCRSLDEETHANNGFPPIRADVVDLLATRADTVIAVRGRSLVVLRGQPAR